MKIKKLLDYIPGWLFLTIIVGITVIFLDPIMALLEKRVVQVEANKLRSDAKTICFRDDFPQGRQLQACRDGSFYAQKDNDNELHQTYLKRLCDLDDPRSCYEYASKNFSKITSADYQVLLEKACRNGAGGIMLACGKLAQLIEDTSPEFAKKYLEYACAAGHKKFCK